MASTYHRDEPMRQNAIIRLYSVLSVLSAVLSAGARSPQPGEDVVRSGFAPTTGAATEMRICFNHGKSLDLPDVRSAAVQALMTNGFRLGTARCTAINISVAGRSPGCAVLFDDSRIAMGYQVLFDSVGRPFVSGGRVRHGLVPMFGGPSQGVIPEGAVRVYPQETDLPAQSSSRGARTNVLDRTNPPASSLDTNRSFAQPSSPPSGTSVALFFSDSKVLDLTELRSKALDELASMKLSMPRSAHCQISVEIEGERAGCTVVFTNTISKLTRTVRFDSRGTIERAY